MNNEQILMQKLMLSKKIMEKHNEIGRGQVRNLDQSNYEKPMLENYQPIPASYNIPEEYLNATQTTQTQSKISGNLEERISKSKLPDEIKKLMLEHPIQQPTMGVATNPVLSDDLVAKASRLMNTSPKNEKQILESSNQPKKIQSFDYDELKNIVRETMQEVLYENGLLVESETKSSEMFKFRVGQHLFEGKVLKIKKITK